MPDVTTRLRTKAEWVRESGLMDAVCERGNLKLAYQRVVKNQGAAGVDGIGMAEFDNGRSLTTVITELNPILRGWMAYFKLTETRKVLEALDGWIRHKLRYMLWRQWKRSYTRAKNSMKAGLTEERAFRSAFNQRGPRWNSGANHTNQAFPKTFFDRLGLVSLLDTMRRLQCVQ